MTTTTTDADAKRNNMALEEPRHFLGLFTVESWREFKRHGGGIMGFNEKKYVTAQKIRPGDKILCYLSKVSSFVAVLEVTGTAYLDHTPIWTEGVFPVRLPVRISLEADLSSAIPIRSMRGKLSFMPKDKPDAPWTWAVLSAPALWKPQDGKAVISALKKAAASLKISAATSNVKSVTGDLVRSDKPQKKLRFSTDTRVGRIIKVANQLFESEASQIVGSYDSALSFNKVTGYSVNVPIASTCNPTRSCLKTCYFAVGASSYPNSLRHQGRVFESIKADPVQFAERVLLEYDKLGLTFLRWNGGGDLFSESVEVINYIGRIRPDVVLWVVTRIPEFAAKIEDFPNIFIHFSLDKDSLARRSQFLKRAPRSHNYFFSYQCEPEEVPPVRTLGEISVLFFDNYVPACDLKSLPPEIVCPLNGKANIRDTCVKCRWCFNGGAVKLWKNKTECI